MAAQDNFPGPGLTSPASNGVAVTPSDSVDLANVSRGLLIGTAGNVQVTFVGQSNIPGTTTVLTGLSAGSVYPFRVTRVWSTNTTAGSIVSLF